MRILIKNGLLLDPASKLEAVKDLAVDGGRILALGEAPAGFSPQQEIDASGLIVCPGLIDLCARMREPGAEHKATIASETRAAASAGITTLCHPPDTNPVIDTPAVAELIQQQAREAGYATVLPVGALTKQLEGTQLSEMAALKDAGCIAVANIRPVTNTQVLRQALQYASTHDMTVFLTPVDTWLSQGCAHEGAVATRLGLPAIPAAAETAAVARALALIEDTGVRAHFMHLSTARAAQMIGRCQYDGHQVSCDTAAHQLFLTEMDISTFNPNCHVLPPLRSQRDRDGLRHAVSKGIINSLCSDHQPHEPDAKQMPFGDTEPGISALETLLPLTLKLVEEGVLPLSQAIARLTLGPARILGLDTGTLAPGTPADLCLFDPEALWQLDTASMHSRGTNTPFDGWQFKGRVHYTLHNGRIVFARTESR